MQVQENELKIPEDFRNYKKCCDKMLEKGSKVDEKIKEISGKRLNKKLNLMRSLYTMDCRECCQVCKFFFSILESQFRILVC